MNTLNGRSQIDSLLKFSSKFIILAGSYDAVQSPNLYVMFHVYAQTGKLVLSLAGTEC